jgi:Holliday junction DNA helicase RuvA
MIGTLRGQITHKDLNLLIVEVHGVGYKVSTTTDVVVERTLGEEISLYTYLAVRETALDLYGFLTKDSLDIFELLITISGIGPKSALGIMNTATPEMLRQAVATEDTSYLTKVAGIGKRNAEKIVMELKDKLVTTSADFDGASRGAGDVMEALLSLGYDERDVRETLKRMPKDITGTGERVKYALKNLSQKN